MHQPCLVSDRVRILPQGIVFRDGKALGRVVSPRVDVADFPSDLDLSGCSRVPVCLVTLVFDFWQPVGTGVQQLSLRLQDSDYRVQILGKRDGSNFALPFAYAFSGREAAGAVGLQLQKLEYIRGQREKYAEASKAAPLSHPSVWGQRDFTYETGAAACRLPTPVLARDGSR